MVRQLSGLRFSLVAAAFGLALLAGNLVAIAQAELGDEVLRLEMRHFRAIEAAIAALESENFPPDRFDIDDYQVVLHENEHFITVRFIDKVLVEDCDHPTPVPICFVSGGTPKLQPFDVTVSKDASRVFGWEFRYGFYDVYPAPEE